ncbi:MAG: hypothetical protein Q8L52_03490 [bacterium]|nr:hypothetical protein [bacterium]
MNLADMAADIAAKKPTLFRRVFVFAGSFDPFAIHHLEIVGKLIELKRLMMVTDPSVPVDIVVWPISAYASKQQVAAAEDRKGMLERGLAGLDVVLQLDDLLHDSFGYTSTYEMQNKLALQHHTELQHEYFVSNPSVITEVWHVIGADNVDHIKEWNEGRNLWERARFIVIARPGYEPVKLPPRSVLLVGETFRGTSCTNIRTLIAVNEPWEHFVPEPVADYIKTRGFYQPKR